MRMLWVVGIAVAGLLVVMAPSAQAAAPIRSGKGAFQENVRVENIKTIRNSCKLACVRGNTRVYFYRTKMNPNPNPYSLEDSARS